VIEALAAGRPVVSTRIGAEGLRVSDGKEVCLADDPDVFAEKVLWLLRDRNAAEAMGRAGRSLVEQTYDWTQCLAPLDTLYQELLLGRGPSVNDTVVRCMT
jgi:glycosyltransferase involved in cell wall biosynthesis